MNKFIPLNGMCVLRDIKEQNTGGLIKTATYLHEDKFIGEIVAIGENEFDLKVGDKVLYDGTIGQDLPKVKNLIDEELVVVPVKKILLIICSEK